jgi:fucose 4-O-acetylase-like acetyltransferase
MPLFIFISGYFSKKVFDSNSIIRLLLIYLIFNYLYLLADYIFGVPVNSFGAPKHAMWYIFSLICWRCLLVIIPNRLLASLYIWLPISIFISVLSGFIPLYKGEFCLIRTLCFLPYFLGGFYCRQHDIITKFIKNEKNNTIYLILLLALAYSIICQPFMSRAFYVGYIPYKGIDLPVYGSLLCRLNSYIIAVVFSVFLLLGVHKYEFLFTKIRFGNDSMFIYLYHFFFVLIIDYVNTTFDIHTNILLTILYTVLTMVLLRLMYSIPFFLKLIPR